MKVNKTEYSEPDIKNPPSGIGMWRPFQLAFLLSCLQSTVEGENPLRENVELIFFQLEGKTEAYLGLISF